MSHFIFLDILCVIQILKTKRQKQSVQKSSFKLVVSGVSGSIHFKRKKLGFKVLPGLYNKVVTLNAENVFSLDR